MPDRKDSAMTRIIIDRRSAPPCPAPKRSSVPQVDVSSHPGADNPGGPAPALVAALLAFAREWRERRRGRCRLASMSERELQDIGVCRSDIAFEIGKPFWQA
jgi:uncharacterized protein YjiS (DUF1127 family)